jgi:hypothetical protein
MEAKHSHVFAESAVPPTVGTDCHYSGMLTNDCGLTICHEVECQTGV